MSTDYSKMSDTEIAQKVFFWLSNYFCQNGGLAHINSDGFFFFDNRNIKRKFDPCNNPADAWPIIEQNKITIMFEDDQWTAFGGMSIHHSREADWDFCEYDKKPLRAAMIVFLMMQEKSNGG